MGLRARNEKEKENMRNLILTAATKLIVTDGYDKLSMRKLANEIEYSPTTLYIYYKDKAQIVGDISMQIYEKIVLNIQTVLEANKDITIDKQLELTFREFIMSITNNSEMGIALIRSGTSAIFGPSEENVQGEHGIDMLQDMLVKGQQQSILRKLDENVSWMLITALVGFSLNAIENQLYLSSNWSELVSIYAEMLLNGLLAGVGESV